MATTVRERPCLLHGVNAREIMPTTLRECERDYGYYTEREMCYA